MAILLSGYNMFRINNLKNRYIRFSIGVIIEILSQLSVNTLYISTSRLIVI